MTRPFQCYVMLCLCISIISLFESRRLIWIFKFCAMFRSFQGIPRPAGPLSLQAASGNSKNSSPQILRKAPHSRNTLRSSISASLMMLSSKTPLPPGWSSFKAELPYFIQIQALTLKISAKCLLSSLDAAGSMTSCNIGGILIQTLTFYF